MITVLVSRCLLGDACRYDGKSKACSDVVAFLSSQQIIPIPICPECDGGLLVPRPAGERVGDKVLTADGTDLTAYYRCGAEYALKAAKNNSVAFAILKAKSPSCGVGKIYDGSFSRTLVSGNGVTADLLTANGIPVFTEDDLHSSALLALVHSSLQ